MNKETLLEHFLKTRKRTEEICINLETEDYSVQPEVFVSPPKWHLAHTTWFFEQFVLCNYDKEYKLFHSDYNFIFNSYYNNVGEKLIRAKRGLITRPIVKDVFAYRDYVTKFIVKLFKTNIDSEILAVLEIGIHHEEQHQELLIYDIKYILGNQVQFPRIDLPIEKLKDVGENFFIKIEEGIYEIGHQGVDFCYDNELGRHKVFLHDFEIASELVSNKEYIEFIEAGGYHNFNLWHDEGLHFIRSNNLKAPLYWYNENGKWKHYTLNGLVDIDLDKPVSHVSYYEAYAYTQWRGMRLPTEFEWEVASKQLDYGQLWEWTGSAYLPYPGFEREEGALGEYNGKFMVNQHVLRGGSIASPESHVRKTYRNFFHPNMQWMYAGIRLVK